MGRTLFCPNCGTQVEAGASFCTKCGTSVRSTGETIQPSAKEKGGVLEDSVADYFRRTGFDVEPRVRLRDRFDVHHEIDVLASKRESYGTIRVAVECKYVKVPMDIKEIRNFHDKLSALGITKGVFVSTGGFTTDAESHATALGIELWDMKTLQSKVSELENPQKDVIHDALPIKLNTISGLSPRHLKNFNVFSETIEVVYRPHYFMDYHCFSQHTVSGNSVIIESRGKMAVDGVTGQVVDCATSLGQKPSIPETGTFLGCSGIRPQTVTTVDLPTGLRFYATRAEIDSVRARELAKIELVRGLSLEYEYRVATSISTRSLLTPPRRKLLKPRKKDIDILNVQGAIKVPILIGTYRLKNYVYTRKCLASTGALTLDQTASCLLCRDRAIAACENCGALSCSSHARNCLVCGKNLCRTCAIAKGVISKKYYCTQHSPI